MEDPDWIEPGDDGRKRKGPAVAGPGSFANRPGAPPGSNPD